MGELERLRGELAEERHWRSELQSRLTDPDSGPTGPADDGPAERRSSTPSPPSLAGPCTPHASPLAGEAMAAITPDQQPAGSWAGKLTETLSPGGSPIADLALELSEAAGAAELERQQLAAVADQLETTRECAEVRPLGRGEALRPMLILGRRVGKAGSMRMCLSSRSGLTGGFVGRRMGGGQRGSGPRRLAGSETRR